MLRFASCCVVTSVIVCGSAQDVHAQAINAVEEDWELNLNTPNSLKSSPQLTCTMSPIGNADGFYATFDINKRSVDGRGGGLQVQLWHGQGRLAIGKFTSSSSLYSAGERLRWTTRLSLSNKGVPDI